MVSEDELERAVAALRAGGLVVFPTETVYGVAADARSPAAVLRVFEIKRRPREQPLALHLPAGAAVEDWAATVPAAPRRLIDAFWPGPLTLVLPAGPAVPSEVTGGGATVGLRMPDDPVFQELARRFAGAIAGTSANRHGEPSPTSAEAARQSLGGDVDVVLDGGPCAVGRESTVVDCSVSPPVVVRWGAVAPEALERVLGEAVSGAPPCRGSPG